jgi:hypothetical protein
MGKSKGSLKGYELRNLLFFLSMIVILSGVCWWFYHMVTKDPEVIVVKDPQISSEATTGDISVFELDGVGGGIVGKSRTYRGRLEIPSTDDGLIRGLFDLPGVEEIVIEPKRIIVKKNGTVTWEKLSGPVRDIVSDHLHPHY